METRQSQEQQETIWIANVELARSPGHPFYQRLNELLDGRSSISLWKGFAGSSMRPGWAGRVCAHLSDGDDAGSLDDPADAAPDRRGDTSGGIRAGALAARKTRTGKQTEAGRNSLARR